MKYNVLALAPVLVASADALLSLNVDFKLPLGIELPISVDVGPKSPPPEDCIDLWHPPHHGVDMDGCDDDGQDGWHWVHPGRPHRPQPHQPTYVWTTLTVTATHVNTVIDCPPGVPNCPNRQTAYATVVVPETTTICPVPVTTEQYIPPPVTTTNVYVPPAVTTSYESTETKTWETKTQWTETWAKTWAKTWETEASWTKTPWTKTWVHEVSTPVPQPPPVKTPCYTCEYPVGSKSSQMSPPPVSTPVWAPNQPHSPVTPVVPGTPGTTVTHVIPVTPVGPGNPGNPGTPVPPPGQTTPVYPPPAGYTTVPSTGQPGYCPGPGCPSFSTVGTVTHPPQQTPTSPVVVVNGGVALNAHAGGLAAAVAAVAVLL